MARYKYQDVMLDGNGKVIQNGSISVFLSGTNTPASVYTASAGGVAVNAVSSGTDGYYCFYVDDGDYGSEQKFKLYLSKDGYTPKTIDEVFIAPFGFYSRTDVDTLLALKSPIASPTFTGTVGGITKGMVGLGNVENTALSSWVGTTNVTTLGTVGTGLWNGTKVDVPYGGTNKSSWTANVIPYASSTTVLGEIAPTGTNTYLKWSGSAYSWGTPSGTMTYPDAGIAVSTGTAWGTSLTAGTLTLTNITQITNRSHTSLSDIGTLTHATIDTYLDQAVKQASSPTFTGINLGSSPADAGTIRLGASSNNIIEWKDTVSEPWIKNLAGGGVVPGTLWTNNGLAIGPTYYLNELRARKLTVHDSVNTWDTWTNAAVKIQEHFIGSDNYAGNVALFGQTISSATNAGNDLGCISAFTLRGWTFNTGTQAYTPSAGAKGVIRALEAQVYNYDNATELTIGIEVGVHTAVTNGGACGIYMWSDDSEPVTTAVRAGTAIHITGARGWNYGYRWDDIDQATPLFYVHTPGEVFAKTNYAVGDTGTMMYQPTDGYLGLVGDVGVIIVADDENLTIIKDATNQIGITTTSGVTKINCYPDLSVPTLGIGTSPSYPLDVVSDAGATSGRIALFTAGNVNSLTPNFTLRGTRGNVSSATAVQATDPIGAFFFDGYTSTGWQGQLSAGVRAYANENFTASAKGSYLSFETTKDTEATRTQVMKISTAGTIINIAGALYTLGLSGSTVTATAV